MKFFILLACLASSWAAIAPPTENGIEFSEEEKELLIQQLEDEDLAKELQEVISNLDDEQLEKLEAILSKDLDSASEFDMLLSELEELGMEKDDIEDLLNLSKMMEKFLKRVPEVEEKVLEDSDYSLEDHCKLYLLGLPNNLGPLGFIALHSVLQGDESDIEEVKIGEFVPGNGELEPQGDIIQRKLKAQSSGSESKIVEEDIVSEVLKRRRRAMNNN